MSTYCSDPRIRRVRAFMACVITAVLVGVGRPASAQVLYGSIVGNVQDSSGAALPGATVTITDV